MRYKKFGMRYIVKIDKGEEIVSLLSSFAKKEDIKLATFSAIGAVSNVTIGSYELSSKSYHWKDFSGDLEVNSLFGNITLLKSEQFIHAHINISDENLNVFGGHLKQAIVGVTLEVVLELIDGEVERKFNGEIGLNLLDLN